MGEVPPLGVFCAIRFASPFGDIVPERTLRVVGGKGLGLNSLMGILSEMEEELDALNDKKT